MKLLVLFVAVFAPQSFATTTDRAVDATSETLDISAQLSDTLTEALGTAFCGLIGCDERFLKLNIEGLERTYDWNQIVIGASVKEVADGGTVGRTEKTFEIQPLPERTCSDDMMLGTYDETTTMDESTSYTIDECCAKTTSDKPKWSWRDADIDGDPGICRIWGRDAEPIEVEMLDDFPLWIENSLWFHGDEENLLVLSPDTEDTENDDGSDNDTEDTGNKLLQDDDDELLPPELEVDNGNGEQEGDDVEQEDDDVEQEDDDVELVCDRSEMYEFLDRDIWDTFGTRFFTTYENLVRNAINYENINPTDVIDELTKELFDALARRQEFVDQVNKACTYTFDVPACLEMVGFDQFLEVFDDWITNIRLRMEIIMYDPVMQPLLKLDQFYSQEVKTCLATREGRLIDTEAPTWYVSKSGQSVRDDLNNAEISKLVYSWSVNYNRNKNVTQTAEASVRTGVSPWVSSFQEEHYEYFEFTQEEYNFEFELTIERWTDIGVIPGSWYDTNFFQMLSNLANTPNGFNEPYTLCPTDGKTHILGEGGILESMVTRLYVANDMNLTMTADVEFVRSIESTLTSNCTKFGPICTGLACGSGGNVLLGGDDLINHGRYVENLNIDGWLYVQKGVANIMSTAWRPTAHPGMIVALGSADRTFNYWDHAHDAGEAIKAAAHVLGYQVIYYDGPARINQFFDELRSGQTDPKMIWIAGSAEKGNDMDASEGEAITENAPTLMDYVKSGGGLMSHGFGSVAYGWLEIVFPGLFEVAGCQSNGAKFTNIGKSRFIGMDDTDLQNGACHSHFEGELHGLEILAKDGNGDAFIIGGFSGAISSGTCEGSLIETEQVDERTQIIGENSIESLFRITDGWPRIIGTYAPKYYHQYCVNNGQGEQVNDGANDESLFGGLIADDDVEDDDVEGDDGEDDDGEQEGNDDDGAHEHDDV